MQFASLSPHDRSNVAYAFCLNNKEQGLWDAASSDKRTAFEAAIQNESLTFRSCKNNRLRVAIPSSVEDGYERPVSHIQEVLERALEHLK